MKVAIRLIVTALMLASVGFGVYYYFNSPQSTLNTFTLLAEYEEEIYYTDFDSEITTLGSVYAVGTGHAGAHINLEEALDVNYHYYKQFLLFVDGISTLDQQAIDQKISIYNVASEDAYDTLAHFNIYQADALTETQKTNMFNNFISKYQVKIVAYYNLVEELETFVLKYAFNNSAPEGLEYTLLNVQKDFVNAIIEFKLESPSDMETLGNELSEITDMYLAINEDKPQTNSTVLGFIAQYKVIANKYAYYVSLDKANYIHAQDGDEEIALQTVDDFLATYDVE
jgi:hypothetical protein